MDGAGESTETETAGQVFEWIVLLVNSYELLLFRGDELGG